MNAAQNIRSMIDEKVLECFYATGVKPRDLLVSPGNYRQLLEMKTGELRAVLGEAGCEALTRISTPLGQLRVIIDELLPDTRIALGCGSVDEQ